MDTASYDWLILTRSDGDFNRINKILNGTSIRFDQNLMVSYPYYRQRTQRFPKVPLDLCENNFRYKRKKPQKSFSLRKNLCNDFNYDNCSVFQFHLFKNEYGANYFRSSERFKNLTRNSNYKKFGTVWPLVRSGITYYNESNKFGMINVTRFSLARQLRAWIDKRKHEKFPKHSLLQIIQYFKVRLNSTLYARFLGK